MVGTCRDFAVVIRACGYPCMRYYVHVGSILGSWTVQLLNKDDGPLFELFATEPIFACGEYVFVRDVHGEAFLGVERHMPSPCP